MEKIIEIEGAEYAIEPAKPWQIPLLRLYLDLSEKKPKNVKEAKEMGKQIEEIFELVLANVTPKVPPKHRMAVFNAIQVYTAAVTNKALSFFQTQGIFSQPIDQKSARPM